MASVDVEPAHDGGLQSRSLRSSSSALDSELVSSLERHRIDILNTIRTLDPAGAGLIRPTDLKRALVVSGIAVSSDQYQSLLDMLPKSPNGSVKYREFFGTLPPPAAASDSPAASVVEAQPTADMSPVRQRSRLSIAQIGDSRAASSVLQVATPASKESSGIDAAENMIKDKFSGNISPLLKAIRLYDYNRDGKILMKDLQSALEQVGVRFTDQQFEKLWSRYDYLHTGRIDYNDFLVRLGLIRPNRSASAASSAGLSWERSSTSSLGRPGSRLRPASVLTAPAPAARVESRVSRLLESRAQDAKLIERLSFDELESLFRKKMKSEAEALQKVMQVNDPQDEGLVDIEHFRSALNQFIFPMSDSQFEQLIALSGVKASGKLPWRTVLRHFQSPLAMQLAESKGAAVPIPLDSHHYNPVRGAAESTTPERLLELLHEHVQQAYGPSLRAAFLQLDTNRTGKITRGALRKVIDSFKFRISDAQFNELIHYLDPEASNSISYKKFLAIFETREELERGHKWLKSVHRFNDKPKAINMAWQTTEQLLAERLSLHWRDLLRTLASLDLEGAGFLAPTSLRRVLERYAFSISDEHFSALVSKVNARDASGRLAYMEFLERLGVNTGPRDNSGISAQIIDGSIAAEDKRRADQSLRNSVLSAAVSNRSNLMEPDEVIARLKDRILQHSAAMLESFHEFSNPSTQRLSKRDFLRMLASFGMHLSKENFVRLCETIQFPQGGMAYVDFLFAFQDVQLNGTIAGDIERRPNHRWNSVRGDEFGLNAQTLERRLHDKIRENFQDLRSAFEKFDPERKGYLTRDAFRHLLESFMCLSNEDEFAKLCESFGLTSPSARLSYKDFLDRFEIRDRPDGHKWLTSNHRFNKAREVRTLTAAEVRDMLCQKAHEHYRDMARTFCTLDRSGRGRVTRASLRELLHTFEMPMEAAEFEAFWASLDTQAVGHVSYEALLENLGIAAQFSPGDMEGTSRAIVKNNIESLRKHLENQKSKQEKLTRYQALTGEKFTVDEVLKRLRARIRDAFGDVFAVFRKYDANRRGFLTAKEIRAVLEDLYLYVSDKQLEEILARFGMLEAAGRISYVQFLNAVHDEPTLAPSRLGSSRSKRAEGSLLASYPERAASLLSPAAAENLLRAQIQANTDTLLKAFQSADSGATRRLATGIFLRVLSTFCFPMNEPQSRYLLQRIARHVTPAGVAYLDFLDDYSLDKQSSDELAMRAAANANASASGDLSARLRAAVGSNRSRLLEAFEATDYAKIGVVSIDDMRRVLKEAAALSLDDKQVASLRAENLLPLNGFGNVNYRDLLRKFGAAAGEEERAASAASQAPSLTSIALNIPETIPEVEQSVVDAADGEEDEDDAGQAFAEGASFASAAPALHTTRSARLPPIRPSSQMSAAPLGASTAAAAAEQPERPASQMASAELVESRIRPFVSQVHARCRARDVDNTGHLTADQLAAVLNSLGVRVSSGELTLLVRKYSGKSEFDAVDYVALLRNIAVMRPLSRQQNLFARKKLHSGKIPELPGDTAKSEQFEETMLRVREVVLRDWKELGRAFRELDTERNGFVESRAFRATLARFHIVLDDEEAFHIFAHYDPKISGRIPYNSFLRSFLETA